MARSFVITRTFAGIEAAGIEASAARGIETARRAMPRLARLLGRGMAALALAVVACGGAPVAWGQEQADIPLKYTAPGKDPIYLHWNEKFLKNGRLGPINFEKCSEDEDGNDLKCASTVMYTGKMNRNNLKSFYYCKYDKNQFALEAYQKNAYSGLKIPVIYFGEKALGNLSLHILEIDERLFSSLSLRARRIKNGRKSKGSRNDLLLHPVVLHKEGYAPQPVIVVCDSMGGYESSCDSSKAARELAADYIKPGNHWTAPLANDVRQTCKPVTGNDSLISQNMGVPGSGAGAGAAGGAPPLRVRFVDKNGKQKDTGYGYIHILPGACTDDTQAARGTEWKLNTMISLPSDLHYEQKKRGKKDEAPICIVLKKKKGHGAEPACHDWTYVKGDKVLQVPADGLKPCPRGTFNFKVLVDRSPVPAGELMALLQAKGIAASQARGEDDIVVSVPGEKRNKIKNALSSYFDDTLRWVPNNSMFKAKAKKYMRMSHVKIRLVMVSPKGKPATNCRPKLIIPKESMISGRSSEEIRVNYDTKKTNFTNGIYSFSGGDKKILLFYPQSLSIAFSKDDDTGRKCRLKQTNVKLDKKKLSENGYIIISNDAIFVIGYHIANKSAEADYWADIIDFHKKASSALREANLTVGRVVKIREYYWSDSKGGSKTIFPRSGAKQQQSIRKLLREINGHFKSVTGNNIKDGLGDIPRPKVIVLIDSSREVQYHPCRSGAADGTQITDETQTPMERYIYVRGVVEGNVIDKTIKTALSKYAFYKCKNDNKSMYVIGVVNLDGKDKKKKIKEWVFKEVNSINKVLRQEEK